MPPKKNDMQKLFYRVTSDLACIDSAPSICELVYKPAEATRREIKKETTEVPSFEIQSVLSNRKKNAFTVVWTDGTHTTVHCQLGDDWDDEKALAMCFTKKALGNKGNFNDKFNDALDNKMKTIREEKEVKKLAPVCANESRVVGRAVGEANIATPKTLGEKISSLENLPKYNLFIRYGGDDLHAGHFYGKKVAKEKARELACDKFGRTPYYYRTWMEGNCLVIDFGSHSTFIVIEGMTSQEWIED